MDAPFRSSQRTLWLGFALLVGLVAGSLWLSAQQSESFHWVRHTLEVQNRILRVRSDLQDAETGERGYLLTGVGSYLQPYDLANARLAEDLRALSAAVADNPRQQANVRVLSSLADALQSGLKQGVSRRRAGDLRAATASVALEQDKAGMDQARRVIRTMMDEERRLLVEREHTAAVQRLATSLALVLDGFCIVGLAVFALGDARRQVEALQASAATLSKANAALQAEADARRSAEGQVRQLQKMESVGQLTGGIAHDFNNMLAVVIGSLDMAKRRLDTDRARAEICIDSALEGARRAAQLTARLLAFSRQQALEPRALDVNRLVGGMSEMLRRTIGETVRVETVLAGGLWRAFVDASQLENALLNLAVNGRDAMPGGGCLTIETANSHLDDAYAAANEEVRAGQYVMVSVSDAGTGMPPSVIERAFEPFYTTKAPGHGTGLGLSQVHGFIKQSGGHVKIYSEPGAGTTVKLYLPRSFAAEPGAHDDARSAALVPPIAVAGEVILVVEDDEAVRRLSVDVLRELGYGVLHAPDAHQAMAVLVSDSRVDLLFTDIVMPEINGKRLADQAREARPDLKVLYTTGYTRNAVVHNGVVDADVSLVAKPFTVEQLARKVRQILDGG